ncbi:MAG: hypothetical protein KBE27_03460 [Syntrophorhabdaceae bacterium]|nr:hypothetical protein [Syntrophorhabdaceae bacterium]
MEKEEINTENTQQDKAICYVCGIKLPKKEMVNCGKEIYRCKSHKVQAILKVKKPIQ